MRLVAFEKDGKPTLGVVDGDQVIDLALADSTLPQDLVGLLCAGKQVFARIAEIARTPSAKLGKWVPSSRCTTCDCLLVWTNSIGSSRLMMLRLRVEFR